MKPIPENERCQGITSFDSRSAWHCTRRGTIIEDGRRYCKQHAPSLVKARSVEQENKWHARWKTEDEKRAKADAEQAEMKRRAGLFPELVEVAGDILSYLQEMAISLPQGSAGFFSQRNPSALRDRLRATLAKAKGVST